MQLLSVVVKYFQLLNHLKAGDIFTRYRGQQGYKTYMYMSYRKESLSRGESGPIPGAGVNVCPFFYYFVFHYVLSKNCN